MKKKKVFFFFYYFYINSFRIDICLQLYSICIYNDHIPSIKFCVYSVLQNIYKSGKSKIQTMNGLKSWLLLYFVNLENYLFDFSFRWFEVSRYIQILFLVGNKSLALYTYINMSMLMMENKYVCSVLLADMSATESHKQPSSLFVYADRVERSIDGWWWFHARNSVNGCSRLLYFTKWCGWKPDVDEFEPSVSIRNFHLKVCIEDW